MTQPTSVNPPNTPFLDSTGNVSREWWRFFFSLNRNSSEAAAGEVSTLPGSGLAGGGAVADGIDLTIAPNGVQNGMIRQSLATSVIGRFQGSDGDVADIQATADNRVLGRFGGQLVFKDLSLIPGAVADGDYGDITVSGVGTVWTIDAGTVTLAKMANLATDRLIGRDTAGTGVPEALTVGGGVEFTGSGGIQRSALSGDVSASAGSGTTAIGANAVTYAKFVAATQKSLVGATAAGNFGEITLGSGVAITAGVLSATGAGGTVTTVSIVTANGISGSVADPTTTPAITLTLGAITPSSVAAVGTVTGSNLSGTNTGNQTITLSGDVSGSGTGAITATLATVNANVGSFGSATQTGTFTVNAKGLVTAAANATITPAASSITGGAALTKADDTNVTVTLGGAPSTALLAPASLTLGWSGTLSVARGGTGGGTASGTLLDNISGFSATGHLVRTAAGTYAFRTLTGTTNQITVTNGSGVSGNPTVSLPSALVLPGSVQIGAGSFATATIYTDATYGLVIAGVAGSTGSLTTASSTGSLLTQNPASTAEYWIGNNGTGAVLKMLSGALGNYANDALAAIGGVGVGYLYRNGSVIQIRVT